MPYTGTVGNPRGGTSRAVIEYLSRTSEYATVKHIAKRLGLHQGSVANTIGQLHRRGQLRRKVALDEHRQPYAYLLVKR